MAFNNEIIKPKETLLKKVAPMIFNNVRSTTERTSLRKRQCYKCMDMISKGDKYINHQYRYDGRIITINFCKECF